MDEPPQRLGWGYGSSLACLLSQGCRLLFIEDSGLTLPCTVRLPELRRSQMEPLVPLKIHDKRRTREESKGLRCYGPVFRTPLSKETCYQGRRQGVASCSYSNIEI